VDYHLATEEKVHEIKKAAVTAVSSHDDPTMYTHNDSTVYTHNDSTVYTHNDSTMYTHNDSTVYTKNYVSTSAWW